MTDIGREGRRDGKRGVSKEAERRRRREIFVGKKSRAEEDALWTCLALHRYDELVNGLLVLFRIVCALDSHVKRKYSALPIFHLVLVLAPCYAFLRPAP